MQRVRIGLTGLAFVFVLVLLGAVFRSASDEEPITVNTVERDLSLGNVISVPEEKTSTEPLAELGVAPGNSDTNSASAKEATADPEPLAP